MDRARYERLRELFHAAVDLAEPRRSEFLEIECAADAALRAEVESLLAARERAAPFLEPSDPEILSPLIGKVVGRYEIVREIAAGGMGTVYEAVQQEPRRSVALKVLRSGAVGRDAVARFRHEAQALGRLAHPGIAHVHEAGTHDDGTGSIAWFTMELVADALPLTRFASSKRLSVRERLALFVRVCEAVEYAHRKGVVHRDLKPSNVLVDAAGNPKVLDFGLAKITDSDLAPTTMRTQTGQLLGTVAYMSPEQVSGEAGEVDARCDVYSLGVILYELLGGRLPIETASKPLPESLRAVCEDDPTPLGEIDRSLKGDLETIAAKALEKDRARRYPSVAALAADVERVLRHEPISARPASTIESARKFARRHRGLVAGVAASIVALAVGLGIAIRQAVIAMRARDDLAIEEKRTELGEYVASIAAADAALRAGDAAQASTFLEAAPVKLRDWEWWELEGRVDRSALTLTEATSPLRSLALAPDGSTLFAAAGRIHGFDTRDWRRIWSLDPEGTSIDSIAVSSDGRRIAGVGRDGARMWTVDPVGPPRLDGRLDAGLSDASALAFAGGRGESWIASRAGELLSWDGVRTVSLPWQPESPVVHLEASADGRLVAVFTEKGMHVLTGSGAPVGGLPGEPRSVLAAAFSPDGSLLAEAEADRRILLWRLDAGRPVESVRAFSGATAEITSIAFSRDGSRLLASSADHGVRVWSVDGKSPDVVLTGHRARVCAACALPDGRIVSASDDRTIKIWDPDRLPPTGIPGLHAVFAPDGSVYTLLDHRRCRWQPGTACVEDLPRTTLRGMFGPATLERANRVLVAGWNERGLVQLFDLSEGSPCDDAGPGFEPAWDGVTAVAFSPDGRRMARPLPDGSADLVDLTDGRSLAKWTGPWPAKLRLAFSPDGSLLATLSTHGDVALLNGRTGAPVRVLSGHGSDARCVAFAPDGKTIATGSLDRTARLWSTSTGETLRVLRGHAEQVEVIAFSPGGTRLATGGFDGTVRLWDVAAGREVARLRADSDDIYEVQFGPDGDCLLAASHGRSGDPATVNLWHAGSEGRRLALASLEELLLPERVVARLEADASLAPAVREDAIRTARSLRPDAGLYNTRAWSVVGASGSERSSCERALRLAEAACALDPTNGYFLNTLGAAQYRCEKYGEAVKTLERAEEINRAFPPDLAFLVMCRARMGDLEGARSDLARLEDCCARDGWIGGEPQALEDEAKSVLASCSAGGPSR